MTKKEFKRSVNKLKRISDAELRDLYFTLKMDLKEFEIEAYNFFDRNRDEDTYWGILKGYHEMLKNMNEELFAYIFEISRRGLKFIP